MYIMIFSDSSEIVMARLTLIVIVLVRIARIVMAPIQLTLIIMTIGEASGRGRKKRAGGYL